MAWLGPLILVCDLIIAYSLVLAWRRRWSKRYSRAEQLRIGWLGITAVLFVAGVGFGAVAFTQQTYRDIAFASIMLLVGSAWLFFGNVLMAAIRNRPD